MKDFISSLVSMLCVLFFVITAPFVVLRIIDNWDKPSYPHTGFSPESPTWEAPDEEEVPMYGTHRK